MSSWMPAVQVGREGQRVVLLPWELGLSWRRLALGLAGVGVACAVGLAPWPGEATNAWEVLGYVDGPPSDRAAAKRTALEQVVSGRTGLAPRDARPRYAMVGLVLLVSVGVMGAQVRQARLVIGPHHVELDGVRVDLAQIASVEIAGRRLRIRRRGQAPLETGPLLDPEDVGHHLEAAIALAGLDLGSARAEHEARRRLLAGIGPLAERAGGGA